MNPSQLRQTIQQQIAQLPSSYLQIFIDFLNLLLQKESPTPPHPPATTDFRPPSHSSLLSHTESWEGDDFESCLETVIETRSQLQA
jgi:hypothetical protein